MSYTAKRMIILLMMWGLIVFVGVTVRINSNTPSVLQVTPTAVSSPTAAPVAAGNSAALQEALARNPNDMTALLGLANLAYQARDWTQAIDLYERDLTQDPHNVDVLVHVAAAQLYDVRFADAKQSLQQAVQLAPDRTDAHLLLGLALSRQSPPDLAGAQAEWKRVIALAPGSDIAKQAQDLLDGGAGANQ
ncbi:MAG TPA: tetratricopeptide repeat protein [Rhizomicrobium sp.]|nr:tetratricopeptide repeat protein [Rhizomicrobium sp.]